MLGVGVGGVVVGGVDGGGWWVVVLVMLVVLVVVGGGVGVPGTRYDIGVGFEIGYEVDHDGRAFGDVVSICWCWRPCGGVI